VPTKTLYYPLCKKIRWSYKNKPLWTTVSFKIHPTSCVKNISGWAEKQNGQKCEIYPDGTIDYDCEFYADKEADVPASLMYSPNLPSVINFFFF
jgi:hypothetical protein